jgi:hypothetical protein
MLIAPNDGDGFSCMYSPSGYSSTVDFIWSEVTDPSEIERYEWVLELVDDGATEVASNSTTNTSHSESVGCSDDYMSEEYRWRVRAVDGAGNIGPYSDYYSFFIY